MCLWRPEEGEEQEVFTRSLLLDEEYCTNKANCRALDESLVHIENLKAKINGLVFALKTVAGNLHLGPDESANIRDAIANVGPQIPIKAWLIGGL